MNIANMCTRLYMVNKLSLVIIGMFQTYRCVCCCMYACVYLCVCMHACFQSLLFATSYKKGAVIITQKYFASLVVIKITGGSMCQCQCVWNRRKIFLLTVS